MNYSELLQYQGYIYLNSIFEPEDNTVIVDIDRCKINGISVGENDTSSSNGSIEVDDTLPIIQLVFDWYIAYSVRNESFTALDEYYVYEGRAFSLNSKSQEFIEVGTIAEEIYPGTVKY